MLYDATPEFVSKLCQSLSQGALRADASPYLSEPRGRVTGQGTVIAPVSVDEVATVLQACNAARVGVVPYGGGTGLVGGQIMGEGALPVILSLERMNRIRAVHPSENVIVADAGVILAEVQAAAAAVDRLFPLSLASEGSARIGGLLGTNAGGVNVLRYGNARAQVLGVEAVTAEGRIWHGLTRLRKDNTGYDLRDLLIGSEGTLGVITAAALRLVPIPAETGTALLAVNSPEAALDLLALAGGQLGDAISAFELIHRQGLDFLAEVGPHLRAPLDSDPEWLALIEVGLPSGLSPEAALETLFEAAVDKGLATDGVVASSEAQRDALWTIRESIPEANRRIGSISSHDIALPLSEIPGFIERMPTTLATIGDFRINCFGHLGDGNLHYNVFAAKGRTRADYPGVAVAVRQAIYDEVHRLGGSISAEHGIGRLKVADLQHYGDPTKLAMMRAIKAALDPNGILNPGAVL